MSRLSEPAMAKAFSLSIICSLTMHIGNFLRPASFISVEQPVIQGKSRNVRDALFCICGMVLDILSIVVGRGFEGLVSLSYLHWGYPPYHLTNAVSTIPTISM